MPEFVDRTLVRPPRVLFVSHETTLSGAPIQLVHLVRWLKNAGWEVAVAAPDMGPISEMLAEDGITTVMEPTLLTDLQHEKLRELCRGYDVMVANTIASWPAVRAAHLEKRPVLWYLHETQVAVRLVRAISEIRPAMKMASVLVTPTRQTARVYEGLTLAPIEVVPYGIPRPPVIPAPRNDSISFVTLGSFEPRKGQDVLLEAIHQLDPETRRQCSFKMAGRVLDEEFFEKLRNRAEGLENTQLIDALDHSEATALLNQADAVVLPSRDETMPIVILEAMGLGKGVISTDVGGIREWVQNEMNGLLVTRENPDELARAIARFVKNPPVAREISAAGLRTFERHFTLDRFASRFAELLRSLRNDPPKELSAASITYQSWIAQFDTRKRSDAIALRRRHRAMRRHPVISVILPVYNPEFRILEAAINSIEGQIYEHWELCMADDASTDPKVRPYLEQIAARDPRIKLIFREQNGHISACSNSALGLATGEWCALLDQDDLFADHALAMVALEIEDHPDAGLIYSDEDKIDSAGVRSNPFFKPDWNPELFLGQNFINHLGVYQTELLRSIGGFREGFEGSQDYDLALRCVERLQPAQVRHIPRILYHWRAVAGSLAAVADAKPYAKEAARRAIGDHLERQGVAGRVEACPENVESHRVIYELPDPAPLVSIIIPMRDRLSLLKQCLAGIRERTDYRPLEIVIVDNDSKEAATHEFLCTLEEKKEGLVLRVDGEFNFSRLINRGAAAAKGEVLAFLNNDIDANEPDWLRELVSHAVRPGVGAVGARLWYPNGTLQHGGVVVGLGGVAGHAFTGVPRGHAGYFNRTYLQQYCSAVTGACLLVRKEVFDQAGGFDETNLAISFNDIDFCLRLRAAGFQNIWTPYANLVHHESASRGHQRAPEEQAQFVREATFMQRKWGTELRYDPFYNPNLSLNLPGFELAVPPRLSEDSSGDRVVAGRNRGRVEIPTRHDSFAL
jgi:glycosyltransferase involved in cell wall biosynthesis/GT2 family glycosyltransferase